MQTLMSVPMQMVGANTSARTLVDPMSARVTRDTFYRTTTRLVQQHPQVTRQPVWLALVRPARPITPLPAILYAEVFVRGWVSGAYLGGGARGARAPPSASSPFN